MHKHIFKQRNADYLNHVTFLVILKGKAMNAKYLAFAGEYWVIHVVFANVEAFDRNLSVLKCDHKHFMD